MSYGPDTDKLLALLKKYNSFPERLRRKMGKPGELMLFELTLHSLPPLPSDLKLLVCSPHQTTIPELPEGLTQFGCAGCKKISSLPTLPPRLEMLNCVGSSLSSIPSLPPSLQYLDCTRCPLSSIPSLPQSLRHLDCSCTKLQYIPSLPLGLKTLICGRMKDLQAFPWLPSGLRDFLCADLDITELPPLPEGLIALYCFGTKIESLPPLPPRLEFLNSSNTPLQTLPPLPNTLSVLGLNNTKIESLPHLPPRLIILECEGTPLKKLPHLPPTLRTLACTNTPLVHYIRPEDSIDTINFHMRLSDSVKFMAPPHVLQKLFAEARNGTDVCPITLAPFSESEQLSITSCYHIFDTEGLNEWRAVRSTCPTCTGPIQLVIHEEKRSPAPSAPDLSLCA